MISTKSSSTLAGYLNKSAVGEMVTPEEYQASLSPAEAAMVAKHDPQADAFAKQRLDQLLYKKMKTAASLLKIASALGPEVNPQYAAGAAHQVGQGANGAANWINAHPNLVGYGALPTLLGGLGLAGGVIGGGSPIAGALRGVGIGAGAEGGNALARLITQGMGPRAQMIGSLLGNIGGGFLGYEGAKSLYHTDDERAKSAFQYTDTTSSGGGITGQPYPMTTTETTGKTTPAQTLAILAGVPLLSGALGGVSGALKGGIEGATVGASPRDSALRGGAIAGGMGLGGAAGFLGGNLLGTALDSPDATKILSILGGLAGTAAGGYGGYRLTKDVGKHHKSAAKLGVAVALSRFSAPPQSGLNKAAGFGGLIREGAQALKGAWRPISTGMNALHGTPFMRAAGQGFHHLFGEGSEGWNHALETLGGINETTDTFRHITEPQGQGGDNQMPTGFFHPINNLRAAGQNIYNYFHPQAAQDHALYDQGFRGGSALGPGQDIADLQPGYLR